MTLAQNTNSDHKWAREAAEGEARWVGRCETRSWKAEDSVQSERRREQETQRVTWINTSEIGRESTSSEKKRGR